jgi:type I restriction enzyme S subunit
VAVAERIILRKDDILVCVRNGSRALIGKCLLIDERMAGQTFGAFMAVFRSSNNQFLYYCFQSDIIKRQIDEHLGATINQITNASLNSFLVPVPGLGEQEAIALVLSDVDDSIQLLEELIIKKRGMKQAVREMLLTGRSRLSGFDGPVRVLRFEEVARPRPERIDPSRVIGDSTMVVDLEHIESGTGALTGFGRLRSTSSGKSVFDAGDVLFGKLRAYLRKYWLADRAGACSTEIWVFRVNIVNAVASFVRYLVESESFIDAASNAYGTHMPRSDWKAVRSHEVRVPPIDEQIAIADVLTDLDRELAVLQARLDKARAIRQGMIQQLVTGRTRLVSRGATS